MILDGFFLETKSNFGQSVIENAAGNYRAGEGLKNVFLDEVKDYVTLVVDMFNIDMANGLGKSVKEFLGQMQCPVMVVNNTIIFKKATCLVGMNLL